MVILPIHPVFLSIISNDTENDTENDAENDTIVTRIIVNGEMAHFSTQQEIEPDRWDAKGNRTLGLRSEERTINMILDEIEASLHRYYYDCQASGERAAAGSPHEAHQEVRAAPQRQPGIPGVL